ncbi:MAG: hypothetical protein FWG64_02135 [Firmicutes bacterium]|nr:hypothetical protein [Bacillota bacterium]
MLSIEVQNAMLEFDQVDELLETILKHLNQPISIIQTTEWLSRLENLLYLHEDIYHEKKANLTEILAEDAGKDTHKKSNVIRLES